MIKIQFQINFNKMRIKLPGKLPQTGWIAAKYAIIILYVGTAFAGQELRIMCDLSIGKAIHNADVV